MTGLGKPSYKAMFCSSDYYSGAVAVPTPSSSKCTWKLFGTVLSDISYSGLSWVSCYPSMPVLFSACIFGIVQVNTR